MEFYSLWIQCIAFSSVFRKVFQKREHANLPKALLKYGAKGILFSVDINAQNRRLTLVNGGIPHQEQKISEKGYIMQHY